MKFSQFLTILFLLVFIAVQQLFIEVNTAHAATAAQAVNVRTYNAPFHGNTAWVRQDTTGVRGYPFSPVKYAAHATGHAWIAAERHHTSFRITRMIPKGWQYPYVGSGYQLGHRPDCAQLRDHCYRYPATMREANHVHATASAWLAGGFFNYAFDLWFTRAKAHHAYPGDSELMIWLARPGIRERFDRHVTILGSHYGIMRWVTCHRGRSWHYIAYVRTDRTALTGHHAMRFRQLPLGIFIRDAVRHGYLPQSGWLQAVDLGFELLSGGPGNSITDFRLDGLPVTKGGR